jgi:hypothetical protein
MSEVLDTIHLNVDHFSALAGVDNPDVTRSVAASQLREYLDLTYGRPMPQDEAAQRLAGDYYTALGTLSTDTVLRESNDAPFIRIPRLAQLLEVCVSATNAVGVYVDTALEAPVLEDTSVESLADVLFMLGLHDIGSVVVASQLELRHPRLDDQRMLERTEGIIPSGHVLMRNKPEGEPSGVEVLIASGLIGGELQRRLQRLLDSGQAIIDRSSRHYELFRAIIDSPDEGSDA